MNTIQERFDGVNLVRPLGDFRWCHPAFDGFPACCGAGTAGTIGNDIVPESILGMKVSPACFVHDWMFNKAPRTWANFHYANSVFLVNLLEINRARGGSWFMRYARKPLILGWYAAVSSAAGSRIFFSIGA